MAVKSKDKGKKTKVKTKVLTGKKIVEDKKQTSILSVVKEERTIASVLATKLILKPNIVVNKELLKVQIIKRYTESYLLACRIYVKRGTLIDVTAFNRCCDILQASRSINNFDVNTLNNIVDIIKKVEYISTPFDLVYIFANAQTELFRFISEYNNYVEEHNPQNTIDIAYRIVFDELVNKYRSKV